MDEHCYCLKSKYAITKKGAQFLEQTFGGATGLLADVEVSALMEVRDSGDVLGLLTSIRKYRAGRMLIVRYTPPEKLLSVVEKMESKGLIEAAGPLI